MKSVFGQVFPINSLPACRLVSAGIDRISTDADVKFEACRRYYQQVDSNVLFFSAISLFRPRPWEHL